jgi:hypothetical protein
MTMMTAKNSSVVLIAQYSACVDDSIYSTLLNATSPVNQAYARHWGHDYILLRATPYLAPDYHTTSYHLQRFVANGRPVQQEWKQGRSCDDSVSTRLVNNISLPSSRSTYNKITLLSIALAHPQFRNHYHRLLILDADAMMVRLFVCLFVVVDSTTRVRKKQHSYDSQQKRWYIIITPQFFGSTILIATLVNGRTTKVSCWPPTKHKRPSRRVLVVSMSA